MSIRIRVFKCDCTKVHTTSGVTYTSLCACGRRLWEQMWRTAR